jgi:hypothetical protein
MRPKGDNGAALAGDAGPGLMLTVVIMKVRRAKNARLLRDHGII